jgi:ABC-type transport system involved in Fe-S cluster assembly fused permease/ATPase subunit
VHFGYDPDREILKGIDLDVAPGTMTAVVGPSGAGKSTLSRLLFRFYEPTGGRITIDGQDIAQVTQASLRAAIGIVPQDTCCSTTRSATISATAATAPARPRSRRRRAAPRSTISSLSLPDGYDRQVGERGLKLSGGEKQRVAIARTLLKDPPILILDEATSALDSRTEAAIQETLRNVAARRTSSSSPTASRPWSTPTRSSSSTRAGSPSAAPTPSCCAPGRRSNGLYADMWARQQSPRQRRRESRPRPGA